MIRSKTERDVPPGSQAKAKKKSGSPAVMAGAASAGVAGALNIEVQELPVAHVYLNNSASD